MLETITAQPLLALAFWLLLLYFVFTIDLDWPLMLVLIIGGALLNLLALAKRFGKKTGKEPLAGAGPRDNQIKPLR